ncbi:hypothetical protein A2U01_0081059, partial [Trifolium medium]|nr:hypothetical protein [Trifolium medium]
IFLHNLSLEPRSKFPSRAPNCCFGEDFNSGTGVPLQNSKPRSDTVHSVEKC